jgi:hypothetical protein
MSQGLMMLSQFLPLSPIIKDFENVVALVW